MKQIPKLLKLDCPLILASQSPRRKKLLSQLGLEFTVVPPDFDEESVKYLGNPQEYVSRLAEMKARNVSGSIKYKSIIIASDTIVVIDNKILNKPKDKLEASTMLKLLSNRTHVVFTGIAILNSSDGRLLTKVQNTEVTFRELNDLEISAYIETGSPMDKSGAYGIQDDFGAVFVSHVNGCYYNIVGLPLELLYSSLKTFLNI